MRTTTDRTRLAVACLLAVFLAGCTSPRKEWAYTAGTFTLAVESANAAYDAGVLDGGDMDAIAPAVEGGNAALTEARLLLPAEGQPLEDPAAFRSSLNAVRVAIAAVRAMLAEEATP